ncbi:MAG: type transport system permease protein [Mycobacteriales bacterium]|jgi:ABC-2 type transport system permease protein
MTVAVEAVAPDVEVSVRRVFLSVLARDVLVIGREFPSFLARVVLQPLFLLFIFGRVLSGVGYASSSYKDVLFPGLMGLIPVMTAMQSIAIPLMLELGWTKELNDRLLAPMSTGLLAVEKLVFAVGTGVVATVLVPPAGLLIVGSVPWRWSSFGLLILMVVLGGMAGAGLGLLVGTIVPPQRVGVMLTIAFPVLLFTGASQYSWRSLGRVRWFQVLTAANPITYVNEGMRAALTPQVVHLPIGLCLAVLAVSIPILGLLGVTRFTKRVMD